MHELLNSHSWLFYFNANKELRTTNPKQRTLFIHIISNKPARLSRKFPTFTPLLKVLTQPSVETTQKHKFINTKT